MEAFRSGRTGGIVVAAVMAVFVVGSLLAPSPASAASSPNLVRYPTGTSWAVAAASEIYSASYPASAAIDGNTTTDWAAIGYAPGDWWRVTLGQPITLDRVKLYPRDGSCETFGFGRVRFSDGTAVPFDLRSTTNSSNPLTVDFAAKERIAWVEVVTDGGGSTCNSGLAEVAAFDTAVSASANLLRPSGLASYSSSTAHGNQPTPLAADGNTQTDWAVAARAVGAWWRVDWSTPQTLDRVQLYPRDNASDNFGIGTIHFSDSSTVAFNLTSYTNSSVPLTLDFTRRSGITWMKVVTDNGGGNSYPGLAEVAAFDTVAPPVSSIPDLDAASDTAFLDPVPSTMVLRPTADAALLNATPTSGTTAWNLVDEVVLDASDNVYAGPNGYAFVSFGSTGLDPDQAISQVVVRANVSNNAPANGAWIAIRRPSDGEVDNVGFVAQNGANDQTVTLPVRTWDGLPWTVDDVDDIQVGIVAPASSSGIRLRQVWVEVTYSTREPAGYDSDQVTADTTPTFTGTVEPGADLVELLIDDELVASDSSLSGGTWEITTDPLADGTHLVWVRVTDTNDEETETGALVVTIDTQSRARLTSESDTGALAPTPETLVLRPDGDVALTGNASLSSGSTAWSLIDEAILRTSDYVFVRGGSVTVSFPDSGIDSSAIVDSVTLKASVRNPASAQAGALFVTDPATSVKYNVGTVPQNPPAAQSVTLSSRPWDGSPWTVADVDALLAGASCNCPSLQQFRLDQLWVQVAFTALREGAYDSDGITSDTTPTVGGNNSTLAARVDVLEDDVVLASDITVSSGAWEVTLPALSEGPHTLEIRAYDGDDAVVGGAPPLEVVIDTIAPPAPSTPDLDAGSDTGVSSGDDITDDITPAFSGTVPSGAVQVELLVGGPRMGSDGTIGDGTWSVTAAPLVPGTYDVRARSADAAGNTGLSGALEVKVVAELLAFVTSTMPSGTVGSANYVTVVIHDETGEPVDSWTGTISLASSDAADTFPDGPTFAMTAPASGTGHTFRVVFGDTGTRTLTASASGVIPGASSPVTVTDVDLDVQAPTSVVVGQPFPLTVTPRRADGRVARQYLGQVTLNSTGSGTDYGPDVDGQRRYQFTCVCGDGHTFTMKLTATGTQTVTVTDPYGNSDAVEIAVSTAPTTGTDPVVAVRAVRWEFGTIVDYYLQANAPLTVLAVEDISTSNSVLSRQAVGLSLGAGYHQFSAAARRDGHVAASNWYQASSHRIWYLNASGRLYSKSVSRVKRFTDVPDSAQYDAIDPGEPVISWTVSSRDDAATRIQFVSGEPFVITSVQYSFQGTGWTQPVGTYYVSSGTNVIEFSNDPATCYFNTYKENNNILIEYEGLANGRQGRIISGIVHGDQRYSGSCTIDPPASPAGQSWLGPSLLDILSDMAERLLTIIGDPIDASDGFANGPVADIDLGGLAPALSFTRVYDGEAAERAFGQGAPDTLLGPGWLTSLDWRIETFGTDPEGVILRAGDGGRLAFLRNPDDSYTAIGGAPFTFEEVTGGYELRRLDRTGYRFDENGRLDAVLARSDLEMELAYDGSGHLDWFADAAGRTATVTTDGDGLVTRIDLPDGRHVDYAYDGLGRLTGVTDLSGNTLTYELDRRGRILRILDSSQATLLQNIHDGQGRVIRQVDGAGGVTDLSFDPQTGTTQGLGPRGDLTTFYFDQQGKRIATYDAEDAGDAIDYDSYGHLRRVTDQLGAVTHLTNDPMGRLLEVADPLDREMSVEYDSDGDPTEIVDAEGRSFEVDYDLNKLPDELTVTSGANSRQAADYDWTILEQLDSLTEPGGATTRFDYDAAGYLESVEDEEDRETTYEVDDRGLVTTVVDPLGNELGGTPSDHDWLYDYDDLGRLVSAADPTGATWAYTYDELGRVAISTDPAGLETTYAYDGAGRLLSTSIAIPGDDPAVTEFEYDAAGNQTAVVDAEGRRTEYEYDLVGRVVLVRDAGDAEWLTAYDAKGRVVGRTDPTDRTTTYTYDDADRLVTVADPGGHETSYTYDDADRVLTVTDELDGVTTYEYDWLGRLVGVTDAEDGLTEYAYDAADDLVSMTDALLKVTEYEYDDTHLLTKVIDALDGETEYDYDAAGRLVEREDARGNSETYGYDAAGRPTTVTDPLSHEWLTVYDAAGRVDHTIDPEDRETTYAYDPLGHIGTVTPDSGPAISYAWDLTGRRDSMTDGSGTTTYGYDPVGRLTSSARGGRAVGYAYDGAGRTTSVSYPGSLGTVTLGHDAEGRLATVSDWDARVTTLGYDALDRVTSITRPDGLVTTYAYDALSRVTAIDHVHDGTPLLALGYAYDALGRLASRTDDQGTATFGYDGLDRLTSADYPGPGDYAYGYDAAGNVTSVTSPSGTVSRTYDAADRIADAGFAYDGAGALLTDGARSFAYDALGRLTGVSGGGHTAAYLLDGDGRRVSQTVDSVTTALDLDLRGGLASVLVAGDAAYLPGLQTLGRSDGTGWAATLADAQGSVLATVDAAGTMGPIARYDPYGGPRAGTTLPAGVGWAGERADPTGLVDLRARAYDPSLQGFLTRDPLGGIPAIPATGNRHAYALGDPLRYTDPSGHFVAALGGVPGGLLDVLGLEGPAVAPTTGTDPLCYDIRVACYGGVPLPWEYQPHPGRGGDLGGLVELGLDAVGFLPFVGDAVDLARAGYDAALWLATGDEGAGFQALLNAGAAVPFVGSLGTQALRHGDDVAGLVAGAGRVERSLAEEASTLGNLSHSSAGIAPYTVQRALTAGKGGSIQAHHLIEKRFVNVMGGDTDDWATVVLTRSEHQAFTNAWRQAIPYGRGGTRVATREQIETAAREIYSGYPEVLRALGLE